MFQEDTRILDLGFEIPQERIAQHPPPERGSSRLLVLRRARRGIEHRTFTDIVKILPEGALLVLNDSKVAACRLVGRKESGGHVELLLLKWITPGRRRAAEAEALLRGSGRGFRAGARLLFGPLTAAVLGKTADGSWRVELRNEAGPQGVASILAREAVMPLPPYLRRSCQRDDFERYQTVYAEREGSVAAPTAGLHFTREVLQALARRGVEIATVTLHIGPGTFNPIRGARLDRHVMHRETFTVEDGPARRIDAAKRAGRPIIAVGTSCVRTLEGLRREAGAITAWSGSTDLFIRPGFEFKVIDGMVTNFHTPRSTPLALVLALAGMEGIREAYRAALAGGYLFYSYGDAMLIL